MSIVLPHRLQAKKMKQGKISSFFSGTQTQQQKNDATPTPAPAAEPATSSKEDSEAPLLPGGRSGARVLGVRFGVGGDAKHNNEGRAITVEYEKVCMYGIYAVQERRRQGQWGGRSCEDDSCSPFLNTFI